MFIFQLAVLIGLIFMLVIGIIDLRRMRRDLREMQERTRETQTNTVKTPTLDLLATLGKAFADGQVQVHMPQELPDEILVEGDPAHQHEAKRVPWDQSLGDSFESTKPKSDYGIYKDLMVCSCGRKYISSVRALV